MENEKQAAKALYELSESIVDLHGALKTTTQTTVQTQKLWREGNKSNLIKIGMACIMFPDPSPVGEIIGAGFLVAGAVQKGVQKRTLYVSDFKKNIDGIQKELRATRDCLRL
jgi:hypothetical protein